MEQFDERRKLILNEIKEIWERNPDKSFAHILYQCGIIPNRSYITDVEVMQQLGIHNSVGEKLKHELSKSNT